MKIGVDCDGVLTDLSAYIFDRGKRYFGREAVNTATYNVADIFQCTKKEELRFWLHYFFPYCKKWPPRPDSVEVVSRLHSKGHKLFQITARMFVTRKNPLGWYSRHIITNWIKRHCIRFDDIYFCAEECAAKDKLAGCHKYNVDIMIEDRPEVALYLADNGIKVLLFDTLYNQGLEHEKIIRVHNWKEIEQVISEFHV